MKCIFFPITNEMYYIIIILNFDTFFIYIVMFFALTSFFQSFINQIKSIIFLDVSNTYVILFFLFFNKCWIFWFNLSKLNRKKSPNYI